LVVAVDQGEQELQGVIFMVEVLVLVAVLLLKS
jgi:hypothetical protein